MDYSVIIAAAGTASRMHLGFNKVLFKVGEQTILERSVEPFINDKKCKKIVVCVAASEVEQVKKMFISKKIIIEKGGETRSHSVFNGLKQVDSEIVLIHDGARPFLTKNIINRVRTKVEDGFDSVVPTITPVDAVLINGKRNSETIVKLVQTPQGFKTHHLKKAYDQAYKEKKLATFRDDASLVEKYFRSNPCEVEGELENIKITNPKDLKALG
jgi:2-C-methyl-D-erythritol 4-phosphate cytidylyltransferase